MLYLIALYCFITILCAWAGLVFYSLIDPLTSQPDQNTKATDYKRPVFLYLISGLILLTALAQWWVIFLPLTPVALIAICLILAILTWLKRKTLIPPGSALISPGRTLKIKPSVIFTSCFLALLLMILTLNAGPTIMDDTDSYHIQMVKWIQQYGTVPGIANLHLRFGFNCSWFTSIGLLSPHLEGINQYLVLNGLLSCWFCQYLLQKIFAKSHTTGLIATCAILAITLLCWPMTRGNAATANYDFITTCCIIALFMEGFFAGRPGPEWIIWPLYLFTVRVLNAPLLLLTAFILFRSSLRTSIVWLLAGAFLIIPFVIRNIILSGYPLFPIWQLDPFSFDWKVSRPLVREISEFIKYYNRSNDEISLVINKPFSSWIVVWYRNLFTYDKILVNISLLAWAGLLISVKRWLSTSFMYFRWFLIVMLLQLMAWLFTAPDPRFVYGILLFPIFTALTLIPPVPKQRLITGIFLIPITCLVLLYSIRKTITLPDYRNWLLPRSLPVPLTQTIVVDGLQLHIPEKVLNNWNPRCFDAQLPCLYTLDPYLRARGADIRDGFKVQQQEGSQQTGEYKIR